MSAFIAFSARASAALALSAGGGGGASPGEVGSSPVIFWFRDAGACRRWSGVRRLVRGTARPEARRVLTAEEKNSERTGSVRNPVSPLIRPQNLFPPRLQPCPAKKAAKPRCVRCHVCSRNRGREPRQPPSRAGKKQSSPSPTAFSDTPPSRTHTLLFSPSKSPKPSRPTWTTTTKRFCRRRRRKRPR